MARLSILEAPDERLRRVAAPVTRFDAALARFADDLFETLRAARAIGLAATQVDVHLQVLVLDVSPDAGTPHLFINPQVLSRSRLRDGRGELPSRSPGSSTASSGRRGCGCARSTCRASRSSAS